MFEPDRLKHLLEDRATARKVEAAPHFGTVEHLIGWLETKPPGEPYSYFSLDNCLLAQYAKAHLASRSGNASWYGTVMRQFETGHEVKIVTPFPNTFGAALKRARAFIRPPLHKRIMSAISRAFQAGLT